MKDKIAVILGGSSGIGAATARLLAAQGARVTIAAPVPVDEMEAIVAAIRDAGGAAEACHCDVTDRGSIDALFTGVKSRHERIDIVINSAGAFAPTPAFQPDFDAVDRLVSINLIGGINVAFAALAAMRPTGGVLVTVTSTQSIKGEPGCSVYAATKAGMAHFLASITPELRNSGIRALCVAPGGTRTPMTAHFSGASTPSARAMIDTLDKTQGGAYGKFFLEPEQVAEVIAFAASDAAGPLQGISLVADQGYTSAMPGLPNVDLS